ncbi:MAG: sugar phosphate isomerase/epimerase family protein [Desulfobacterales bacterium]
MEKLTNRNPAADDPAVSAAGEIRAAQTIVGISTSFASTSCTTPRELLAAIQTTGAAAVELEYRLKPGFLDDLMPLLKKAGLPVLSVHNFCPVPPVLPKSPGGGDLFSLSDPDPEGRREAVRWTVRTLEVAHEAEAGAVVLHCGAVAFDHGERRLHGFFRRGELQSEAAKAFIEAKRLELGAVKPRFLDALYFSLERLSREAERQGVVLGLENRYHYYELPGPDDFDGIFRDFQGAPIGYWHDTGHAHVAEAMGLGAAAARLQKLQPHLIGMHVHDAVGLSDHLPPGEGEIDLEALAEWIRRPDSRVVLELKPGAAIEKVAEGIGCLERLATLESR